MPLIGPPSTRLTLVRHGESVVTTQRVIGGPRTCSGLSPLGRRQSDALRRRVEADGPLGDVVVSSSYPRAIETAEIVAPALGLSAHDIERRPAWGEHDPGPELDGMSFDAYVERFGTPDWDGSPDTVIFPGGETTRTFHERVHGALDALVADAPGRSIVVFCHGGVVDAVFRHLLDLPMTGGFELHTLNTSLTIFEATPSGTWRLARYNDAGHLSGLPEASPRTSSNATTEDEPTSSR